MICPKCESDLEGGLIYDTFFEKYKDEKEALRLAAMYGATKTEGRWGREIGLYDQETDRTVAFKCPDCGHTWGRFKPLS